VCHNPVANMILASGICPVDTLRHEGIPVALGTDGAASNDNQDMFGVLKTAALLHKVAALDAHAITARDVLRMATIEGAKALGLDHEIGSLEIGKAADLAAIDIGGPGYSNAPDLAALLVYSGSGRDTRHVWVAGERLVVDRKLTRRDFAAIRADYGGAYRIFWDRVAARRRAA